MDSRRPLAVAVILSLLAGTAPLPASAAVGRVFRAGVQTNGTHAPIGRSDAFRTLTQPRLGIGFQLTTQRPALQVPGIKAGETSPLSGRAILSLEDLARGRELNASRTTAGAFTELRFALFSDEDKGSNPKSDEGSKQASDKAFDGSKDDATSSVAGKSGSGLPWLKRAWGKIKDSAKAPVERFGRDEYGGPKKAAGGWVHRVLYGARTGLKMVGIASLAGWALAKLSALFPWQLHVSDAFLHGAGRIELMTQVGPDGIGVGLAAAPFDFLFKSVPMMATLEEISYRVLGFGALFLVMAALKPVAQWAARALKKVPGTPFTAFLDKSLGWLAHLSRFSFPVAAGVSALSFALAHVAAWGINPVILGVQLAMGLVLARAFYKTRSLLVAVVAHSVFNILMLLGTAAMVHYGAPLVGVLLTLGVSLAGIAALYYDLRMRWKARRAAGAKAGAPSLGARVAKGLALPLILLGWAVFTTPSLSFGPKESGPRWSAQASAIPPAKTDTVAVADTTRAPVVPLPDLVEKLTPSVVKIIVPNVGTGSGYIIDAKGRIATNAHVAVMAGKGGTVSIMFADGTREKAVVLDLNAETDIAFLQLTGARQGGWPAVPFGDSGKLRAGESVFAMGYPMGQPLLVSQGVVSNMGSDTTLYVNMITVDAAINPGNSGGPLFNMRGQVVGMNSQIITRDGAFIGIGKSISSADIVRSLEQYDLLGTISTAYVGVIVDVMNPVEDGVLVEQVRPGSPAWKAGVRPGDLILGIDGKALPGASPAEPQAAIMAFMKALGQHAPGDKVTLQVYHEDASFSGEAERTLTLASKAPPTLEAE